MTESVRHCLSERDGAIVMKVFIMGKSKRKRQQRDARYHQITNKIKPSGKRVQIYTHGEDQTVVVLKRKGGERRGINGK